MSTEQVQINVRVPADWKPVIEAAAAANGLSLNDFLRAAVRKALPDRGKGLSEPRGRGRPTSDTARED